MSCFIFTSESVGEGHPDKICDQISDAVLDALISEDAKSRVACETIVKNNDVFLVGEITSNANINYEDIARNVIREIGYTDPELGFDADSCNVHIYISKQSPDINQGVDRDNDNIGAGDQGLMFGFACQETDVLMPLPIFLAHNLVQELSSKRKSGVDFLKPDAKAQVSVLYENSKPSYVHTVVISSQHTESIKLSDLKEYIINEVVKAVIPEELLRESTKYLINPTGRFVIGGPVGDAGLTGRKIIVDTYGGYSRHGGGAFSGKDPTKVDRSAAYAARYVAKNIVAAGLAQKCEVQLAYAIGVVNPVSIMVDTFGTGVVQEDILERGIAELFSLSPKGIIEELDLLKPIYQETATYGHFGRNVNKDRGAFSWEKVDKIEALQSFCGM